MFFLFVLNVSRRTFGKHNSKEQVQRRAAAFVFSRPPLLSGVPHRNWFPFENVSLGQHGKVSYTYFDYKSLN